MTRRGTVTLERVGAGRTADLVRPGDLLFVHRRGLVQALIQLGQALRPSLRRWAGYTHVACVVDDRGNLVEALLGGVRESTLARYHGVEYIVAHTGLLWPDDAQAVQFVREAVGQRYGILVFIGTALRMLAPGRGLWFGMNGTEICSGLAARMLERGWHDFGPLLPASMCPAELARALRVPRYAG